MPNFSYLTPNAVGPMWPALLLCSLYLLAVTGLIVLVKIRRRSGSLALAEHRFLHRLHDATQMVGALALGFGLLGAFAGLLEALTAIAAHGREGRHADWLQQVLPALRHVLASLFAGLLLGGLWRELLLFLLKPYTRPLLMPLCPETSVEEPFPLEDPLPSGPGAAPPGENDLDIAEDWRKNDTQGIY